MERFDAIVIGGGVVGTSIACHLARLGAARVLLLERDRLGGGTTAQSSCIVRTHYSVADNVALAQAALAVFRDFRNYLGDADVDCGLNICGLMLIAPRGQRAGALAATLALQRRAGIAASEIAPEEALRIHPLLDLRDDPAVGWEPGAGYADAYMTLSAFARAARRAGATLREGVTVTGLVRDGARVTGVDTDHGRIAAGVVVSAQNMWSRELAQWTGIDVPLTLTRHAVMSLEGATPYASNLPVVMDWVPRGGIYFRSYGGRQVLAGDTGDGEVIARAGYRAGGRFTRSRRRRRGSARNPHAGVCGCGPRALVDGRLRRHAGLEPGARVPAGPRRPARRLRVFRARVQAVACRRPDRCAACPRPADRLSSRALLDRALRERTPARRRLRRERRLVARFPAVRRT